MHTTYSARLKLFDVVILIILDEDKIMNFLELQLPPSPLYFSWRFYEKNIIHPKRMGNNWKYWYYVLEADTEGMPVVSMTKWLDLLYDAQCEWWE